MVTWFAFSLFLSHNIIPHHHHESSAGHLTQHHHDENNDDHQHKITDYLHAEAGIEFNNNIGEVKSWPPVYILFTSDFPVISTEFRPPILAFSHHALVRVRPFVLRDHLRGPPATSFC
jgi:hypothetical protein